jgi:hypothetical protein
MPDMITTAGAFIGEVFAPDDRIALTLVIKCTPPPQTASARPIKRVEQRTFLAGDFCRKEAWLRHMNAQHYEIYWLANTVKPDSLGRQKDDIAEIRRLYLDFDTNGDAALERVLSRRDLPHPNYVVNTSRGKYQVLWNVRGFTLPTAERLLRSLARNTGADIAVTDSAHVLRLPGFFNHKYTPPHRVTALRYHANVFAPADFPSLPDAEPNAGPGRPLVPSSRSPSGPPSSRSEQDMREVISSLRRYEGPPGFVPENRVEEVRAQLESKRPDKHNPNYYATLTVGKALALINRDPRAPRPHTR